MPIILETARIVLRKMTLDDTDFILQLLNEPDYIRFIGDRRVSNQEQAQNYLQNKIIASYKKNGFGLYLAILKDIATPIGCCGFIKRDGLKDVDIGYAYLANYHGQGYATEIAAAVLEMGKTELNLNRIVAITAVDNQGSINVLEKIGFSFEKLITLPGDDEEIMLFGWNAQ